MLRTAIVGLGGIGNRHATIYNEDGRCEVVAVCDFVKETAEAAGARYGCPAFQSVPDMLAAGLDVGLASVCTAGEENGGDHYEPTIALLNAGIPVLGEKPISNRINEAQEMVALAKEKDLRYGINLNHRFTPAAARAKQWVDEGRLGELNIINMTMWINNPNESSDHFHIRALHPHSIDVMRYFCGDVKQVHAFFKRGLDREGKRRTGWSNVQVGMRFANDVVGNLTGSYDAVGPGSAYGLERLEVVGHDARLVLEDACERLYFTPRRSREVERYDYVGGMMSFNETFQSRITRWIEQNVEEAAPEAIEGSGEEALKAQLVIEAAIESWDTGKVVDIPDV